MKNVVEFTVQGTGQKLQVPVNIIFNGGYAGTNQHLVREHIEELAKLGVPAPTTTPTLYPLSNYLATTSDTLQVQHGETSGEVEYAVIWHGGKKYVTVACDHTDRNLESFSVPKSKQACPDVFAPEVWAWDDVKDHFGELQLKCWVTKNGKRELYQDAPCKAMLLPDAWAEKFEKIGVNKDNNIFISGTINTVNNTLVFGDFFEVEIHDPVLNRTISHSYTVQVLPKGIE
ncbi:conserved hypothetical protein [uncultured delta proteobacterium]|uniref:DUF2848 domain-containing protein n=1 Tax=uncultured delta proteobacterium TaxID=34034 RepID=A0A212JMY1_9DELT|nr:conserved hypothetical protein [uncultured delta proteobacterium]